MLRFGNCLVIRAHKGINFAVRIDAAPLNTPDHLSAPLTAAAHLAPVRPIQVEQGPGRVG